MIHKALNTSSTDFDLVIYDEIDSTNDELRRILHKEAAAEPTDTAGNEPTDCSRRTKAVMATRQTKGRGRLGREWTSPPGSLYLSLSLDVSATSERTGALSLVVALAIRGYVAELVAGKGSANQQNDHRILVKWPNDLVCSQGKVAGILIEVVKVTPTRHCAIVGVGININRPATGAYERAAYLSDLTNTLPNSKQAAEQVIKSILLTVDTWKKHAGDFSSFKEEYNKNLSLYDQEVRVSAHTGEVVAVGVVQGVDAEGFLLLRGKEGTVDRVCVGEVTLR